MKNGELLRTDIFLVMDFTEMDLFKFPKPVIFPVVGDFFFSVDFNSTEIISLRHSDFFFLKSFKYS